MAVQVVLGAGFEVTPGQEVELPLAVTNTGSIVDTVELSALGGAEGWVSVVPSSLSLFPGDTGEAVLRLAPPGEGGPPAGPVTLGVLARSTETGLTSVAETGVVVRPVVSLDVVMVPVTSYGRRRASHTVLVTNVGNTPVPVEVEANDSDQLLAVTLDRPSALVGPSEQAGFDVRLRFSGSRDVPFAAFSVTASAAGADPTSVQGTFVHRRRRVSLPLVLVAAALLVAAAVAFRPGADSTALLGSTRGDSAGVDAGTGVAPSSSGTDPTATTGSTVVPPVVAPGDGKAPVPEVVNLPAAEAATRLSAAGFKTVNTAETHPAVPAGLVIRTDPPAGATLNPGGTVTLVVSQGAATQPTTTVVVPDLVGLDEPAARARLTSAGLNVLVQTTPGGTPGRVKTQNPGPGAQVAPASNVSIVLGAVDRTFDLRPTTTATTRPAPTTATVLFGP